MSSSIPPSDFGVARLASQGLVVIFSKSSCCMCHAIKSFFIELKVHPIIHELDHYRTGKEMERVLLSLGCNPSVPAIFIGGKLIGGTSEIISLHLRGSLMPLLNRA
ncbi:hypothetical protein Syun_007825 [Stephania yunnanensis]|uniref:Glutaredoxin domain-containing protein n=1 Tax=Stephania yunnanensis TaxID=152371 RepID=A0AAP0Q0L7_9MAGN